MLSLEAEDSEAVRKEQLVLIQYMFDIPEARNYIPTNPILKEKLTRILSAKLPESFPLVKKMIELDP